MTWCSPPDLWAECRRSTLGRWCAWTGTLCGQSRKLSTERAETANLTMAGVTASYNDQHQEDE
eukprot:13493232-Alexandrium_andersonii.AAC.1